MLCIDCESEIKIYYYIIKKIAKQLRISWIDHRTARRILTGLNTTRQPCRAIRDGGCVLLECTIPTNNHLLLCGFALDGDNWCEVLHRRLLIMRDGATKEKK